MGAQISIAFALEREWITRDFPGNLFAPLAKCGFIWKRGSQIEGYTDIERNDFIRLSTKPGEEFKLPAEKLYDPTIFMEWCTKWYTFEVVVRCYEKQQHIEISIDIDEEDVDREVPDSERRIFVNLLVDRGICIFEHCKLNYLYIDEEAEADVGPSDFSYTRNGLLGITLLSSAITDFDKAIKDPALKQVVQKEWGAVLIKRWDPDPLRDL